MESKDTETPLAEDEDVQMDGVATTSPVADAVAIADDDDADVAERGEIAGEHDLNSRDDASRTLATDPEKSAKTATLGGKIFRTAVVYASYFAVALSLGILGPSLTDLELFTSSSTTEISSVFTCRGVLAICGSLLLGPLLDKVDRYLLVGIALVMDFLFYLVVPWCNTLWLLLVALSPPEFFNCVIGMGTHLICISIWGDESKPSLQLLNLVSVVGFMAAPLLVKPFLMQRDTTTAFTGNHTDDEHRLHQAAQLGGIDVIQLEFQTNQTINKDVYDFQPVTSSDSFTSHALFTSPALIASPGAMTSNANLSSASNDVTTVYVFVLLSFYSLVVGALMLGIYFYDSSRSAGSAGADPRGSEEDGGGNDLDKPQDAPGPAITKSFVLQVSLLYFVFNFFYGGIEIGYAGLVSTFAVKHLGWSTESGSEVTAVVQGANAALTAVAVVLSRYIKPQTFVTSNVIAVIVSLSLLCVLVEYDAIWLWVCTALLGASYASIMPSSISWVDSFMEVDGKFSSAYWAGFFSGFMAIPSLTAYAFNAFHPMWFAYCMLLSAVATGAVYVVLCIVVSRGTKGADGKRDDVTGSSDKQETDGGVHPP